VKISLIDKINCRTAVIGVIGLGYVGLPLSLRFAEVGFKVVGFDIDERKTQDLLHGVSYIQHIQPVRIRQALEGGFTATTDFSQAGSVDALIICVPTPLNEHREPDLSFVIGTVDALVPHMRPGQVISLESTTYRGDRAPR
jgi:UDP-N-acetyl-D-glucosamine dehydrogenase